MNIKRIISSVGIGAGAIIIGLGIQIALADWSPAPPNPPQNNVAAPINVGLNYQTKAGGFSLLGQNVATGSSTLDVEGVSFLRGLIINGVFQYVNGTVASGSVMTSDANGNASWQAGGSGSSGMTFLNTPVTLGVQYGAPGWQTISNSTLLAAGVPSTATAVILDIPSFGGNEYVQLRTSASAPSILSIPTGDGYWAGTNINYLSIQGGQVIQPLSSSGTFDWQAQYISGAGVPWAGISLVGYANVDRTGPSSHVVTYGCTDPSATNYNSGATQNDNSCKYKINVSAVTCTMNPASAATNKTAGVVAFTLNGQVTGGIAPYRFTPYVDVNAETSGNYTDGVTFYINFISGNYAPNQTHVIITSSDSQTSSSISCNGGSSS